MVVCVIHRSISLCYNSWFVFFNDSICFILDRKHLSTSYKLLEFCNLLTKYSELIPPIRLLPTCLQMVTVCWKTFLGDFFFVYNFLGKIINDEFIKTISAPNKNHKNNKRTKQKPFTCFILSVLVIFNIINRIKLLMIK